MKAIIVPFLLASAATVAPAADASLSGNWQVHISIAGTEKDQACTFTQKATDLTGSCSSDDGTVNVSGKIDQQKVTWTYKSEYSGSPITVNYEGSLNSGNKITGTVSVPEYGAEGEFTATPSK